MDAHIAPEQRFANAGGTVEKKPYKNGLATSIGRQIAGASDLDSPPPWSFIQPTTLHGVAVPEREFIVDGWLAPGHVTINYGDGGVGKTLLAQQLMTSCATGRAWCGLAVNPCRALGLFCEDDEAELHRRQDAINAAYGICFSDLSAMTWASGVGRDNTLVAFGQDGRAVRTRDFENLAKQAEVFGARLVVVDTAADTFGGNENARREVRQYVGAILGKMARNLDCAVLLNAHPSRVGLGKDGDLDGGSTAWSNTARARWSLARPKAEDDSPADSNRRILTRRKSNYSSIGDTIQLEWRSGVLVPIDRPHRLTTMAAQTGADAVFLDLLAKVDADGRTLSDSKNAGNFAPAIFAQRPDRQDFSRKDFQAAMQRLFAAGKIRMEQAGRPGKWTRKIAAVSATGDA